MKILHIVEEYGYNTWYAVLSDERFEELKKEWQTIKGLNCLVPVRFLIPEAKNLPLYPEDSKYADYDYLKSNQIEVLGAHIHQSDDSNLADVEYEIPEQEDFEFKGIKYSDQELNDIFQKYRDEENLLYEKRSENEDMMAGSPSAWCQNDGFGPIDSIWDWPEDVPLPEGWMRTSSGEIVRQRV